MDVCNLEAALLIFYTHTEPTSALLSKARSAAEKYAGREREVFTKLGCVWRRRKPP